LPQSTYEDASDDPYFSRHPPPAPSVANAASGPEHDYARILNRILPSSIRILAWSPVSERFDARFSCLGRQYKYFFSSTPSAPLDVDAMHDAAGRLLGEHDFRNFCKIDPSKQLTNFTRGVSHASIEALGAGSGGEQRYVFNLHGTAFLYHQVRCTMALLFLVGSGLEPASVISDLLDVDKVPCKPDYEMAHELPLLLWKCEFDAEALNWQKDRSGQDVMRSRLQEPAIQQTIREHHLQAQELLPASLNEAPANAPQSVAIQLGATSHTRVLKQTYTPLLKRPRGEHFATANERWLASKGDKRSRSTAAECDG
jgi:tRNA pseudouridine38/39 synthase